MKVSFDEVTTEISRLRGKWESKKEKNKVIFYNSKIGLIDEYSFDEKLNNLFLEKIKSGILLYRYKRFVDNHLETDIFKSIVRYGPQNIRGINCVVREAGNILEPKIEVVQLDKHYLGERNDNYAEGFYKSEIVELTKMIKEKNEFRLHFLFI